MSVLFSFYQECCQLVAAYQTVYNSGGRVKQDETHFKIIFKKYMTRHCNVSLPNISTKKIYKFSDFLFSIFVIIMFIGI